jgi:lysyl-tRNA synthetase class 2
MYRTIRDFFDRREFLEVETPLLTGTLIPESTIEIFSTTYEDLHADPKELYLIPSPEVHMKQLLSRGFGSIYQIGKCFRNCEQRGRNHNPEFSMLEWYETGADYRDSMTRTEELFQTLAPLSSDPLWTRPIRRMSMAEVFWDLERLDLAPLCGEGEEAKLAAGWREELARRGVESGETGWEPLFNRFFLQFIESRLPDETPLILYDYPQRIGTLARSVPESPWAQRWELYLKGVELANCYTEETNPEEIRRYFEEETPLNTTGPLQRVRVPHQVDQEYHRHFHSDFPDCSGVALGLDRLLMLLAGKDSLGGVILFPFSDIIAPK